MQMNMVMWAVDRFKRYGRGKLCFGSIIGMDETKTFKLKIFFSMKMVGVTGLGSLWAYEWAWHFRVASLRCVQGYGI